MKPIYELVTAAELKVGDVVIFQGSFGEHEIDKLVRGDGLVSLWPSGDVLAMRQLVLRRLPATESPAVLRRALENACEEIAAARLMDAPAWAETFADDRIERARGELESETTQ